MFDVFVRRTDPILHTHYLFCLELYPCLDTHGHICSAVRSRYICVVLYRIYHLLWIIKKKLAIIGGYLTIFDEDQKKRRVWSKRWYLERQKYSHVSLLQELEIREPTDLHNFLRMDKESFREAVSARERLIVTLRYLATGRNIADLKFSCAISPQLLGKIIPETCWALFKTLKEEYMKFPSSQEEWLEIADGFKNMWDFEYCLGAMDGKHIAIKKPVNSGSFYYNYKGFHSRLLFAIVNANYEFIYAHTGTNGRISDGGVLRETDFSQKFESDT
nr:unnamed protein product [Callosobruchus chinensis]